MSYEIEKCKRFFWGNEKHPCQLSNSLLNCVCIRYVQDSTHLCSHIRGKKCKTLYLDQLSTDFDHEYTKMHLLNLRIFFFYQIGSNDYCNTINGITSKIKHVIYGYWIFFLFIMNEIHDFPRNNFLFPHFPKPY